MTILTRHDATYLAYVETIVRCSSEHLGACARATGGGPTAGLDRDIRWPGYIGTGYDVAPIRVLCAAQVHHGPVLANTGQGIQEILRRIRAGGASPILADQLALEYEKVVASWGPWTKFEKVLRGIDPALAKPAAVAYVNVAKCWQDPTRDNYRLPMRACQPFFPLVKLRDTLKADVVLALSSNTTLDSACVPKEEWLFNFPGRPSNAYLADVANEVKGFLKGR